MVRIILVRPGATPFDDQGRIKGCMDMPLSDNGKHQVAKAADALATEPMQTIYSAPCESALETAQALSLGRGAKIKVVEAFRNIDHGLWHGKLIDELRRQLPRVFRQGQELGESVCPPGGETFDSARCRVTKALRKILKKEQSTTVVLVIPDPLASVVRGMFQGENLADLWGAECDSGRWESLDVAAVPAFA